MSKSEDLRLEASRLRQELAQRNHDLNDAHATIDDLRRCLEAAGKNMQAILAAVGELGAGQAQNMLKFALLKSMHEQLKDRARAAGVSVLKWD